jgi:hypothetical protein
MSSNQQSISTNTPNVSSDGKSLDERIFELEAKAADSELIASLSDDEETKLYNRGLAKKLRDYAKRLREGREPS